jgi:uncharacterized OsmC-like protein
MYLGLTAELMIGKMSVDRPNKELEAGMIENTVIENTGNGNTGNETGVDGDRMRDIGAAIERVEAAVSGRPGFGVGTAHSVTTLQEGLRCSASEGSWSIETDLSPILGGSGSAPTPGVLLRAALGSCMAMTYRMRAARHGVELTSCRVTVEADSELAGMLFCDASAPPGYSEVRYHVEVESPDDPDRLLAILDEGDRLSPLLDVFRRAHSIRRTTDIRPSEHGARFAWGQAPNEPSGR